MDWNKIINAAGKLGDYMQEKEQAAERSYASQLRKVSDGQLQQLLQKSQSGELGNAQSELVEREARRRGV